MKRWMLALVVLLLLTPRINVASGDYVLRPFDVLSINVFGYPELSFPGQGNPESITIRSDGRFAYPLVGEVQAEGIKPEDLANTLQESLTKYFFSPRVTVNLLRFSTERVYILGEVNQPGLYELDKSRNLIDVIGAAKGWTKEAAKTKVFIIHKDQKGEPIRVNLLDLLNKGDVSKNLRLQEGDIVYLTGNNRIDIARDILPLTQIFYNVDQSRK